MKKVLLTLALIPALIACAGNIGDASNDIADSKPITADLTANETLTVYGNDYTDTYRIDGFSSVHGFSGMLELTKVTYTYWEKTDLLKVETDVGAVQYHGSSISFDIVTKYANQDK